MTEFYLIRHGITSAIGHSLTGRLPGFPLTGQGIFQAKKLAKRLRHVGIQEIYSSPSARARETAAFIGSALGLEVVEDPAFCEIDVGEWSGRLFDELNDTPEFALFNSMRSLSRPPSGEMMLEAQTRAVTQLLRLAQQHDQHVVAIVSHADLIKAALAYFLGIPLDLIHRLEIGLCSFSILRLSSDAVQVIAVNRHAEDEA
jgi:broad specificity phosphatase PhoE